MKRIVCVSIMCICFLLPLCAQYEIIINLTDGSQQKIPLSKIESISYEHVAPSLQLSSQNLLADAEATTLQVKVNANVGFTIQMDENANWISLQSPSVADRYQSGDFVFALSANQGKESRTTQVVFNISEDISTTLTITQLAKTETLTVNVSTPGSLMQQTTLSQMKQARALKITGTLNDDDLNVLKGGVWVPGSNYANVEPAHIECDWLVEELDLSEMKTESGKIGESEFFCYMTSLRKVTLPREITRISEYAFNHCPVLTEVQFGDNSQVEEIGGRLYVSGVIGISASNIYGAFKECPSIEEIILPASVKSFYAGAFANCTSLRRVVFPQDSNMKRISSSYTITYTGLSATRHFICQLPGCTSLETIVLPPSLRQIEQDAFAGTPFRTIDIPESVTDIYIDNLFADCIRLEEVKLPSCVTEYGKNMFKDCAKLRSVNTASKITAYRSGCFSGCSSDFIVLDPSIEYESSVFKGMDVENIVFPNGFKTIPYEMFANCKNLKTLDLGEVEYIDAWAFGGCKALSDVSFPTTLTNINQFAFAGTRLKSVYINSKDINLEYPFEDCYDLQTITIGKDVQHIEGSITYWTEEEINPKIIFEEGSSCQYYGFKPSKETTTFSLPASVKTIGKRTFGYLSKLKSVTLNEGLETIELEAFEGCTSIEEITIPSTVSQIELNGFYGCTNLETVRFKSKTPATLDTNVFGNCASWMKILVPKASVDAYKKAWPNYADKIVGE